MFHIAACCFPQPEVLILKTDIHAPFLNQFFPHWSWIPNFALSGGQMVKAPFFSSSSYHPSVPTSQESRHLVDLEHSYRTLDTSTTSMSPLSHGSLCGGPYWTWELSSSAEILRVQEAIHLIPHSLQPSPAIASWALESLAAQCHRRLSPIIQSHCGDEVGPSCCFGSNTFAWITALISHFLQIRFLEGSEGVTAHLVPGVQGHGCHHLGSLSVKGRGWGKKQREPRVSLAQSVTYP